MMVAAMMPSNARIPDQQVAVDRQDDRSPPRAAAQSAYRNICKRTKHRQEQHLSRFDQPIQP